MSEQKRLNLMVCAGTGCVTAGSAEIKEVLEEELNKRGGLKKR